MKTIVRLFSVVALFSVLAILCSCTPSSQPEQPSSVPEVGNLAEFYSDVTETEAQETEAKEADQNETETEAQETEAKEADQNETETKEAENQKEEVKETAEKETDVKETDVEEAGMEEGAIPETVKAIITMEDGGIIELELYPQIAPQSVYNFVYLARDGFYDGQIFHRVIEGFMIQGGDPLGIGIGGPGYAIKGEFGRNGFENSLQHKRGIISMARQGDPAYDSAGSQFFIVHQDSRFLDGAYAAFGKVTSGLDVVDKIAQSPTDGRDKPLEDVIIKTITIDGPTLPEPDRLPE